jgi:hypothetical protein
MPRQLVSSLICTGLDESFMGLLAHVIGCLEDDCWLAYEYTVPHMGVCHATQLNKLLDLTMGLGCMGQQTSSPSPPACLPTPPAAPLDTTTLWQVINSTATQTGPGPVVVTVLYDTSIAQGAPGNPGPQPLNTSSLPYDGTWYAALQYPGTTRLPAPPGTQAILPLARSLVLRGDSGASSSFTGGSYDSSLNEYEEQGVGSTPMLDLKALQGLIKLPSPSNNASQVTGVR